MGEFLYTVHWALRYLVLLAGVATLALAAMNWARTDAASLRTQRAAMAAFIGLLDLQVILGVILLVVWTYYPALIGHIMMMVLAAAAAHAGGIVARRREPARPGAPVRLAATLAALLLIVGGIMAIQRPVI
jgi:hypothetical protein